MWLATFDAGNPYVRFNERGEETWLGVGLRHRRCAKAVGKQLLPHATAGALLLDSTIIYKIEVCSHCIRHNSVEVGSLLLQTESLLNSLLFADHVLNSYRNPCMVVCVQVEPRPR